MLEYPPLSAMFIPARDYGNINVLAPLGPDTGVSLSPPIRFQEPFYDRGYPCSLNSRYDATLVRRSIMLSLHSGSIWPPWYNRHTETAFQFRSIWPPWYGRTGHVSHVSTQRRLLICQWL